MLFKILRKILQQAKNRNLHKTVYKVPSIICNNCIAGAIYSDLKLQFNSPTINLFFYAPDYIKFIESLGCYLSQKITFSFTSKYFENNTIYPVGLLNDIEIHFLHYHNFTEAENDWYKRLARVDYNNLFVIGSDRDLCNDDIEDRFAKLPFKNKVFFTSKPTKYNHEIFFEDYKNCENVGDLIADDKAWYFYFDVPHWINTGVIKRNILTKLLFKMFRFMKTKKKIKESLIL